MKNKLISLVFICTLLLSNFSYVFAITPSAKIELNSYSYTINSLQDVKVTGTVSKAYGQKLIVKNSNNIPILLNDLPNANGSSANFEFTIKSSRISEGTNTFQIQSSNLMGKVSASNPKTITITYKKQSKKSQVITVSDKTVEAGKTINLNATVNSGLQLSYFSKNTDIATVDGKGIIIGKSEGTTKIIISQAGNSTWNSVTKEITVTVNKVSELKSQTITVSNKSVDIGKSVSLGAKSSSNLALTYTSSNTKVATVDKSGKVTGKIGGTAKITISQPGNSIYKPTSKTITVTVNKNAQIITASDKKVNVGKSINIGAKASSGLKPIYKSSNTSIAVVDVNGKVTGKKAGKATITISQAGNDKYKAANTKSITITVSTDTYTIQYNPNGGKGKVYTQTIKTGSTVALTKNKFTKSGYTFIGWSLDEPKNYVSTIRIPSAVGNGIKFENLKTNQKQKMTNGIKVKNFAEEGKTRKVYAVWKNNKVFLGKNVLIYGDSISVKHFGRYPYLAASKLGAKNISNRAVSGMKLAYNGDDRNSLYWRLKHDSGFSANISKYHYILIAIGSNDLNRSYGEYTTAKAEKYAKSCIKMIRNKNKKAAIVFITPERRVGSNYTTFRKKLPAYRNALIKATKSYNNVYYVNGETLNKDMKLSDTLDADHRYHDGTHPTLSYARNVLAPRLQKELYKLFIYK